jgi:hypothetical protein
MPTHLEPLDEAEHRKGEVGVAELDLHAANHAHRGTHQAIHVQHGHGWLHAVRLGIVLQAREHATRQTQRCLVGCMGSKVLVMLQQTGKQLGRQAGKQAYGTVAQTVAVECM